MIICLRPQPDCDADVVALSAEGIEARALPMLAIRYLPEALDQLSAPGTASGYQGLILTSKQAGRWLAAHAENLASLRHLPVWCVGPGSAEGLQTAGFQIAFTGRGGALDLMTAIRAQAAPSAGPFLWLSGRDIHSDIEAELRQDGLRVDRVILYQTEPLNRPQPAISDRLAAGGRVAAMVFSARTFRQFEVWLADQAAPAHNAQITILAASPALAALARAAGFETRSAQTPQRDALLGLCRDWSAESMS